jgi:hypothetical protein
VYSVQKAALDLYRIDGDELHDQYLRAMYGYAFSISLLFPPPTGGIPNLSASQIVSAARTMAAARLFDYRAFNLDNVWDTSERETYGMKSTHKTLRVKALFEDRVARTLFSRIFFNPRQGISFPRNGVIYPKHGISYLLEIHSFDMIEKEFEKRIEEIDTMSELIRIYVLCAPEIKKRSKVNGIDIVIRLYLDYSKKETGDRTLANNWRRLKRAAVFRYLYNYQEYETKLFDPPSFQSDDLEQKILDIPRQQSISELIRANDYIASHLNSDFHLGLPVIDVPPSNCKLRDDPEYRKRLLALLK